MADKPDLRVLFAIVGDGETGKSCIQLRFLEDKFSDVPIVKFSEEAEGRRIITVEGKRVEVIVVRSHPFLYLPGKIQPKYMGITKSAFRTAQVVLICYDTSSQASLDHVPDWIEEIQKITENARLAVVETKNDLPCTCNTEQAKRLAAEKQLPWFSTSAKESRGIAELFEHLTQEWVRAVQAKKEADEQKKEKKATAEIQLNSTAPQPAARRLAPGSDQAATGGAGAGPQKAAGDQGESKGCCALM